MKRSNYYFNLDPQLRTKAKNGLVTVRWLILSGWQTGRNPEMPDNNSCFIWNGLTIPDPTWVQMMLHLRNWIGLSNRVRNLNCRTRFLAVVDAISAMSKCSRSSVYNRATLRTGVWHIIDYAVYAVLVVSRSVGTKASPGLIWGSWDLKCTGSNRNHQKTHDMIPVHWRCPKGIGFFLRGHHNIDNLFAPPKKDLKLGFRFWPIIAETGRRIVNTWKDHPFCPEYRTQGVIFMDTTG